MKRLCLFTGILALCLGAVAPSFATQEIPLLAGQDIPVGVVHVRNNGVYVMLRFELDEAVAAEGWYITETHVHIGESMDDFPLTRKGNPKVGHFTYSAEYPGVTVTRPTRIRYLANVLTNPDFTEGPDGKEGWMAWLNLFGDFWFGDMWSTEYATVGDGCVVVQAFPEDVPDEYGFHTAEYNFFTQYSTADLPMMGQRLFFSGNIGIETPFGPDTGGSAWIKLFGPSWWLWDMRMADAATNGPFTVSMWIPEVPGVNVQVGLLTAGPDPAYGALKACDLSLEVTNLWINELPILAAHAALEKTVMVGYNDLREPVYEVMSESAWADGTRFTEQGNWATWFEYAIDPRCMLMLEVDSVNGNAEFAHTFGFRTFGDFIPFGWGYSHYHEWDEAVSKIKFDGNSETLSFTATYPDSYMWYPSFVLNGDGTLTFVDQPGDNVYAATGTWFLDCGDQ
ncbi:MAG: hypothetical protein AB3N33_10165 [Puniceicoccaceae bacterium]